MSVHFSSRWHHLDKSKRTLSLSLAAFGVILLLTSLIVGVSDNLPGIIIMFLGILSLILSVTHIWKGHKIYLKFFVYSVAGFFVSVLFHNLLYAFAELNQDVAWAHDLIVLVATFFFVLAVLIFPATSLVGLVGLLISFYRNKRHSKKIPL